ncbi:MAG: hypothetical protein KDD14_26600, partial [Saprospiraceae bacterium]|nr:hypothetical protein [Saprospiraceae bacterium]
PFTIVDLKGKNLQTHLQFIAENMPVFDMLEASGERQPERLAIHIISFKHGCFGVNYPEPNEVAIPILRRFGQVFEQTYTRFLDLQKAEAQAREAQIEAALERVRAASMAMHNSEGLHQVIITLKDQLDQLGVELDAAMINVEEKGEKDWNMWLAISEGSQHVYNRLRLVHVPYQRGAVFDHLLQARKNNEEILED